MQVAELRFICHQGAVKSRGWINLELFNSRYIGEVAELVIASHVEVERERKAKNLNGD